MIRVYVALGSNLANPQHQVVTAFDKLARLPQTCLIARSSLFITQPLGPQDQPDYVNAVAALDTKLTPDIFLDHTQRIEQEHGRKRKAERWGPRTLDLDILLFGNRVINSERLIVPHYDMKNRLFMLEPLSEIVPTLIFPDGETLSDCITKLKP